MFPPNEVNSFRGWNKGSIYKIHKCVRIIQVLYLLYNTFFLFPPFFNFLSIFMVFTANIGPSKLEKTLESPLDCKEIQPVHSKGDQSWVFFGRTDAEAETPILWPPHVKSWLIGKDSDAGRDWGQEEKGTTEDEMAGWHHRLNGHETEWTLGVGDGQGGLACWDSWGCKKSDTTEWLNWTELKYKGTKIKLGNYPFLLKHMHADNYNMLMVCTNISSQKF